MTTILAALSDNDKKDVCVKHALKVRTSCSLGNYHAFFKLYKQAPKMAAFLMDWFIARERKFALKNIIKAYVSTNLFKIFLNFFFNSGVAKYNVLCFIKLAIKI